MRIICATLIGSRDGCFPSISNSVSRHRSSARLNLLRGIAGRWVSVSKVEKQKENTPAMEEETCTVENKVPPSTHKEDIKPAGSTRPKRSPHVEEKPSSAGLMADSELRTKTRHLKEYYSLGRKLGHGEFGTTFLCVEKATGEEYACKSIAKTKLLIKDDVDDVRREIQIMHHLAGHPNVISIKGVYEDSVAVHVVMEMCAGGDLFDRIVKRGHYTERKAAQLARTIVGAVEACHSLGVMHRDLKPEHFLFVNEQEDSSIKMIDFGLSTFFKPGETFTNVVGSRNYIAPEVLQRSHGPEADVWSAGVILYVLLSGAPPFGGETNEKTFEEVLHGDLDFSSDPWPKISESAQDLVRRMLVKNPEMRITAREALSHPWLQVDRDGRIDYNEFMATTQKGSADQMACGVGEENGGGEDNGIPSPGWKGRKWIGTNCEE